MSEQKPIGSDGTNFKCPECGNILATSQVGSFPFCSDRCRLLDLNRWLDGSYTVSRPIDPSADEDLEEGPRKGPEGGGRGGLGRERSE